MNQLISTHNRFEELKRMYDYSVFPKKGLFMKRGRNRDKFEGDTFLTKEIFGHGVSTRNQIGWFCELFFYSPLLQTNEEGI
jgi:hypothetical protein